MLGYDVGFSTDMWSIGVLTYILLSGLSPFGGENDDETLEHVKTCDWSMDDVAFNTVSSNAKDFIKKLLVMNSDQRMQVSDALEHPWLTREFSRASPLIPNKRYVAVRDSIRNKYVSTNFLLKF